MNAADYTLAQLVRLNTATADHNASEVAFVKAEAAGQIAPTTGSVSAGQAQLAAQLGVNPADFTLPDLIRLSTAVYDNNSDEVAYLKAAAGGRIVSTQGSASEGHAMLASMLQVNGGRLYHRATGVDVPVRQLIPIAGQQTGPHRKERAGFAWGYTAHAAGPS